MAAINDLIKQISDPALRDRIQQEVDKINKRKKFGLVFEEHLPECTPLYDVDIKKGSTVALKSGEISDLYIVLNIHDGIALCEHKATHEQMDLKIDDLVCVAEFGEPIYPYLKPIDSICNAPDSDLWHTLIEADNYHALQLLEYLYAGKVDCIYIDPPYNTGARDWKYNNDYVDSSDQYRHSKWLSFMEKRLKLAQKLLNPSNSVLIVTIDEKEYLHLGCLLEELFPTARIQMISTCINPGGVSRGSFRRVDEYIFFVMIGESAPVAMQLDPEWFGGDLSKHVLSLNWRSFARAGSNSDRSDRPNLFYPIFVSKDLSKVVSIGDSYFGDNRAEVVGPENTITVWPLHQNGSEAYWMYTQDGLKDLIEKGYFHIGNITKRGVALYYLNKGEQEKIRNGVFRVVGKNPRDGSVVTETVNDSQNAIAPSQWRIPSHNARTGGTEILKKMIGNRFSFPKSVYAVHDTIRFFLANKPDATVIDFFAGSGTTLHAVNLLNAEDGGKRQCIIVTNNEVSESEAKKLNNQGYNPGDPEWENLGIAHYVTWPRTTCSIRGEDINGKPLKGDYLGNGYPDGTPIHMSDGFKANAAFFKLGFLDKTAVALGRQLSELIPVLWLKAGAHGPCPVLKDENCKMMILPENKFAILIDEKQFPKFEQDMLSYPEIHTIYFVTDSDQGYREMIKSYEDKDTYQLYRDYLDNFRINTRR
jgi:adenine-specific DNA-methyltransferase